MQQDHSQQMYDAGRIHKFLGWDFEIATSGSRAFWQISDGGRSYVAAIESLSFDGPRMTIPERPIPVDLTPAWPGAPTKPQPSILTLSHLPPAAHKPSHHIKFHISSSNSQDRMTFACTTFTGFEQIYSCSWLQPIKVAGHESCSSPPSLHRKSWEQEAGGGCSLWCCSGHRAHPPPLLGWSKRVNHPALPPDTMCIGHMCMFPAYFVPAACAHLSTKGMHGGEAIKHSASPLSLLQQMKPHVCIYLSSSGWPQNTQDQINWQPSENLGEHF